MKNPLKKSGFTLIELLVVMVIISIILMAAVLAFGDFGASRKEVLAANQFKDSITTAQQQAILTSQTLRLYITKKGYYYRYSWKDPKTDETHWKPLDADALSNKTAFDNASLAIDSSIPILFSPNGTITPVTVTLHFDHKTLKISTRYDGEVIIEKT